MESLEYDDVLKNKTAYCLWMKHKLHFDGALIQHHGLKGHNQEIKQIPGNVN